MFCSSPPPPYRNFLPRCLLPVANQGMFCSPFRKVMLPPSTPRPRLCLAQGRFISIRDIQCRLWSLYPTIFVYSTVLPAPPVLLSRTFSCPALLQCSPMPVSSRLAVSAPNSASACSLRVPPRYSSRRCDDTRASRQAENQLHPAIRPSAEAIRIDIRASPISAYTGVRRIPAGAAAQRKGKSTHVDTSC